MNYLDREEFYLALRLIALAQGGKELSATNIKSSTDAPLPKFNIPGQPQSTSEFTGTPGGIV